MELKWGELPFEDMPKRLRMIFILYLAGFNYVDIEKAMETSRKTISKAISMGYRRYGIKRKQFHLYMRGEDDDSM